MADKKTNEVAVVRHNLQRMDKEFAAALPKHIPVDRFIRVVLTAVQNDPKLLECNRRSLFSSAVKSAQDGLLPDGREAALVSYKGVVQYLPMVAGIRKKVRNSGEISTWDVQAVYENDEFEFELGDNPFIKHKPSLTKRGKLIAVYSVAKLKDGSISRDVMSIEDVEKIRAKSMAQKGPWSDPTFYPEMAKKTVARRHSKVLPMSTDLDDLMRRDDALYDLNGPSQQETERPRTFADRMNALADNSADAADDGDKANDAKADDVKADADGVIEGEVVNDDDKADDDAGGDGKDDPVAKARADGAAAFGKGMSIRAVPAKYKNDEALAAAWQEGYEDAAADQSEDA